MLLRLSEVEQDTVLSHGMDVWEMDGSPLLHGSQVSVFYKHIRLVQLFYVSIGIFLVFYG